MPRSKGPRSSARPSRAPLQVNARFLAQRVTGVQRYARELIARWGDAYETVAPGKPLTGWRGHLWEQLVLPARLGGRLLWSPSGTGPLRVRRQIVTIHDCAFADHPESFSRAFAAWYQWLVPRLARRVTGILTVSEFSRRRIVELCRVAPETVHAIPNGVGEHFRPSPPERVEAARRRLGLPERYLLCVGSLEPRKNLARLFEAWRALEPRFPEHGLVLAGGANRVFQTVGLGDAPPRTHALGYVDEDDLPAVYSGAELFAYPSLYEGFGLPVLEAMACGTPVVCSRTTSLPEVAGDAAVLVDPLRSDELAEALAGLLEDEAGRARMRRAGLERAAAHTWDRTAEHTWKVLAECLERDAA